METPYRNQKMLDTMLRTLNDETRLCIALDITLPDETIKTMKISGWKKNIPLIDDHQAIFIIQQGSRSSHF